MRRNKVFRKSRKFTSEPLIRDGNITKSGLNNKIALSSFEKKKKTQYHKNIYGSLMEVTRWNSGYLNFIIF